MSISRTSTAQWKRIRTERRRIDQENGVTNCPECGVWLEWDRAGQHNSAETDHIIAHSHGGLDVVDNTRTCCRRCNQSLGGKLGKKKQGIAAVKVKYKTAVQW